MVDDRRSRGCSGRLVIALLVAGFSLFSYLRTTQVNPTTGQKQHIAISPGQEIALGLQAAPQMEAQYGGEDPDPKDAQLATDVGDDVVRHSAAGKTEYQFQFHVLNDPQTINAFALPGGQVFITKALLHKLQTRGELAGVLGHEIGHVVGRHSAEQMAKQQLAGGLTGAAVIASTDPRDPGTYRNAAIAQMLDQLVNLKFSRTHESEADALGVRLMSEAGYDPRAMVDVMKILEQAGGNGGVEFFETHPNPEHRIQDIQKDIQQVFPNGVPGGMKT